MRRLCEDGGGDEGVAVKVPRHDAAQHAALADQGAPSVAAEQMKSPLRVSRNLCQNGFYRVFFPLSRKVWKMTFWKVPSAGGLGPDSEVKKL